MDLKEQWKRCIDKANVMMQLTDKKMYTPAVGNRLAHIKKMEMEKKYLKKEQ